MMRCTFYPRKEQGENREVHSLSWRCCPENFDDKQKIYYSSPLPHWSGCFPSAHSKSSRNGNSSSKESQKVWKVSKILHFFKKTADHFSIGWDVPQKPPTGSVCVLLNGFKLYFLTFCWLIRKIHLRIKCTYGTFICHTIPDKWISL